MVVEVIDVDVVVDVKSETHDRSLLDLLRGKTWTMVLKCRLVYVNDLAT